MPSAGNVVSDTIAELSDGLDREHVLSRLNDWRDRVHALYDRIQGGLGTAYSFDRSAEHRTREGIVRRAGLSAAEVPAVDILRIARRSGPLRAIIQPRHLWVVGANGRLDLIVIAKSGIGRRPFQLLDVSSPRAAEADWRLTWRAEPLEQPAFTIGRLRVLLA